MRRCGARQFQTPAAAAAASATLLLTGAGAAALPAAAADAGKVELVIKDHRFAPAEVKVPARQPVQIVVTNRDATVEEFESSALKVEKIVTPGGSITVHVRPLDPGRYPFIGDYHADTASGALVAE